MGAGCRSLHQGRRHAWGRDHGHQLVQSLRSVHQACRSGQGAGGSHGGMARAQARAKSICAVRATRACAQPSPRMSQCILPGQHQLCRRTLSRPTCTRNEPPVTHQYRAQCPPPPAAPPAQGTGPDAQKLREATGEGAGRAGEASPVGMGRRLQTCTPRVRLCATATVQTRAAGSIRSPCD